MESLPLMSRLRESARNAPRCFSCGLENPNADLLVLAHSNELVHGRGIGHKSDDIWGCIVCNDCHSFIDGRSGRLTKANKHAKQRAAWIETMVWWIMEGYVGEH